MELETLLSCDNHDFVGYFVKAHVSAQTLIDLALDYSSDPEWIEDNITLEDVKHEYWQIAEWEEGEGSEDLEKFVLTDESTGFPVTVFYTDDAYKVR